MPEHNQNRMCAYPTHFNACTHTSKKKGKGTIAQMCIRTHTYSLNVYAQKAVHNKTILSCRRLHGQKQGKWKKKDC